MSDDELNRLFAEKVAGWAPKATNPNDPILGPLKSVYCAPGPGWKTGIPDFCASADAVLPFLQKHEWWEVCQDRSIEKTHPSCWCSIFYPHGEEYAAHIGTADTPAKAAVIALLRAKGVQLP